VSDESLLNEHPHTRLADGVAFVVYGSITVLAAVGGLRLESQALKAREAATVVIVVAVAAWLAHSMWRVVRARARQEPEPEPVRSHELHELLSSWPILVSGVPGTVALLLAGGGAWSVATGLRIAQGLGVAILFAAGLLTARLSGATHSRQLVYAIALPSVGLVIVLLEVAAHQV
jgi:hypothetical protein